MIHSCVFLFSDSCSWVPCLSWKVKLPTLLQKYPSAFTNYLVFQHFCVFEPFPTLTVWFWDPSFHSEDNRGTHMQLLQKIQTLTDAPEEKRLIKSQGVKTCWNWRSGWILLNLSSGKHVTIFCSFWRAVLNEKIWYLGKTRKIYTSSFCSSVFLPRLLMLLIYTFTQNSLQTTIECL